MQQGRKSQRIKALFFKLPTIFRLFAFIMLVLWLSFECSLTDKGMKIDNFLWNLNLTHFKTIS